MTQVCASNHKTVKCTTVKYFGPYFIEWGKDEKIKKNIEIKNVKFLHLCSDIVTFLSW